MKGFGILMIAACLFTAVACSRDESTEPDKALTRGGANGNDSTKQGGETITINDEWAGDTTIHF